MSITKIIEHSCAIKLNPMEGVAAPANIEDKIFLNKNFLCSKPCDILEFPLKEFNFDYTINKYPYASEYIKQDQNVKIFFDVEIENSGNTINSEKNEEYKNLCVELITENLKIDNIDLQDNNFFVAQRSRVIGENKLKYSYRIVLPEFSLKVNSIGEIAKDLNKIAKQTISTEITKKPIFDTSVYRTQGCVNMIGCKKPVTKNSISVKPFEIMDPCNFKMIDGVISDTRLCKKLKISDITINNITINNNFKQEEKKKKIIEKKKEIKADYKKLCGEVDELVNILTPERATPYSTWSQVGMCLKNLNCDVQLFIDFSKKSHVFKNNDDVKSHWNKFVVGKGFKLPSLKKWAKNDNTVLFEKIRVKYEKSALLFDDNYKIDGTYVDIINNEYGNKFVYDSSVKTFYTFDILWKETSIIQASKIITELLEDRIEFIISQKIDDEDISNILKAKSYIGNHPNIVNIVNRCKHHFNDDNFTKNLDLDLNLLGCNNGVIDLTTLEFRLSKPDDMISLSVGYEFNPNINPDIRHEIDDFMNKVYPNHDVREYVKKIFGSTLLGDNRSKILVLFTDVAQGNNGKTTQFEWLSETMGDYYITGDPEFIYQQKHHTSREGHSSNTLSYNHSRISVFDELDALRKFDGPHLKNLSGGSGKMELRNANASKKTKMKFGAVIFMSFNEHNCPDINVLDKATLERKIVIPFVSKFHKSDEEYDKMKHINNNFKANPELKNKFKSWRNDLLIWMIEGLHDYKKNGLSNAPQLCKEIKNDIIKSLDPIYQFLTENFVDKKGYHETDPTTVQDVTILFMEKQAKDKINKTKYKRDQVKQYIINHYGQRVFDHKRLNNKRSVISDLCSISDSYQFDDSYDELDIIR